MKKLLFLLIGFLGFGLFAAPIPPPKEEKEPPKSEKVEKAQVETSTFSKKPLPLFSYTAIIPSHEITLPHTLVQGFPFVASPVAAVIVAHHHRRARDGLSCRFL